MTKWIGEPGDAGRKKLRLRIWRAKLKLEKTRRKAGEILGVLLEGAAKGDPEYWVDRNDPNSSSPER